MVIERSDAVAKTRYKFAEVDGLDIFYREAGAQESPAILLLHGFPTSSQMFRTLIPAFATGAFVPTEGLDAAVHGMLDQLTTWSDALRSVRDATTKAPTDPHLAPAK